MDPSGCPSPQAEQGTRDPVAPQAHPRQGARVPIRWGRGGLNHREADGEVRGRRRLQPKHGQLEADGYRNKRMKVHARAHFLLLLFWLCSITRGVCLSATPPSRAKRDDRGWGRYTCAWWTARGVPGEKRTLTHSSLKADGSAAEHIAFP